MASIFKHEISPIFNTQICTVKQDELLCLVGAIALVFRVIYGTKRYISTFQSKVRGIYGEVLHVPLFCNISVIITYLVLLSYFISACEI